ncbi:hypothetical protein ACIA8K_12540 [Catenuloplanes sp. NPDC051500]|uniref:hypothetical protein n=1 Tax=Catenuloplanes sp. NPDC051500 TaxID=3363959 RepID=UPI00378DE309
MISRDLIRAVFLVAVMNLLLAAILGGWKMYDRHHADCSVFANDSVSEAPLRCVPGYGK